MSEPQTATWTWEPEAKFVAEARHQAERALIGWGVDDTDDIILVLSELITNAIVHGNGAGPIHVHLELDPRRGVLGGAVGDGGFQWPTEKDDEGDFTEHGRGLFLVGQLTTRWGVSRDADGIRKTVWFCRDTRACAA